MITHTSLDAFEERARTGAVTTKVDADLRLVIALINVARAAQRANIPADCGCGKRPCPNEELHVALASVPK